jgi:hypothetical protein
VTSDEERGLQAGYSGTPLVRKLGIPAGSRIALVDAPDHALDLLVGLPPDVEVVRDVGEPCDLMVGFCRRRAELERDLPAWKAAVAPSGAVWVAWPKRTSGVTTDITENTVREVALPIGLVDVKVCAIDATWSGLKLVIRKELR